MKAPLKLADEIEAFARTANAPPWASAGDVIVTAGTRWRQHDGVVICEGFDRAFADMAQERDVILAVMNQLPLIAAALRLAESVVDPQKTISGGVVAEIGRAEWNAYSAAREAAR